MRTYLLLGLLLLLVAQNAFSLPDVVITYLDYNRNGHYTAIVTNQGTSATPSVTTVDVGYTVDGVYRAYGIVSGPLAAGASVLITMDSGPYVIANGTHTIDAFVDDDNKFVESNDANNHYIGTLTINTPSASLPAFPGATGGGAATQGGRGGVIMEVTSTLDSGPGTLRECVQAIGPRTCVFRVGGTIQLASSLTVNNPYLTIAGQTAPGGGILLSGKNILPPNMVINTHDVIVQYIRNRKGVNANCTDISNGPECGATLMMWNDANKVIFDHNSSSWNQDEGIGIWSFIGGPSAKDITISWNLVAEGLQPHPTAMLFGSDSDIVANGMTNIDVHHNIMMNESHRNPALSNKSTRLVNNIVYNWSFHALHSAGGIQLDIIGNLWKAGPLNPGVPRHEIQAFGDILTNTVPGNPSLFLLGNKGINQTNPSGDQWLLANEVTGINGSEIGPIPTAWRRSTPLANTTFPVNADNVLNLESVMLPTVGASQRLSCSGGWIANRDSVDTRLINQYQTNTGNSFLLTSETQVGGFPIIAGGAPCIDTDRDGLPDEYELLHGLNINVFDSNSPSLEPLSFSYLDLFLQGVNPCIFNCGGGGAAAPVINGLTCSPTTVQSIGTTSCTATVSSGTPLAWSWTSNNCSLANCLSTSTSNPGSYTCQNGGGCTLCAQASSANGLSNLFCTAANYLTVRYRKPQSLQAH